VPGKGAIGGPWVTEAVPNSAGMAFPRLQVGPVGQVIVSFHDVQPSPPTTIYVNTDDDGLGPAGFLGANTPVTTTNVVMPNTGPPFMAIPAQPKRGITAQVNLAWDRSGKYGLANDGVVYLLCTKLYGTIDLQTGVANTDVMVYSSTNSGQTWDSGTRMTGNTNSQFMPSIAVDQKNGDVAVV
jgi:hypothetical protein